MILRKAKPPKSHISKPEFEALKPLNTLQEKRTLVRSKKCHYKLIGEGQKSLRHQKLNVTKGGVAESIGVVVTFKVRHQ